MTIYTQPISVNNPKSGTQGSAPATAGLTGAHHDAAQADAVPGTLEQVAQGIAVNRPSAGLPDAINTGQAVLGNRSFMQFVGAAQQQTRAPDADSGNDPLQMMWPNKALRGLPSLTGMSALRPGRTAQKRQERRRNVSLSPQFNAWDKDILFGPTNSLTLHLAIKQEAATDSPIPVAMFRQLDKSLPRFFPAGYLWSGKGFKFADRELLSRRDRPYMDYVREAITAAVTRGGDIYWALGRLHFDKVFSDLFRVRMEHGNDPVEYMAKVSYPDLMDKHGRYIDADTGQVVAEPPLNVQGGDTSELEEFEEFHRLVKLGRIKVDTPFQPLITTVEIIGFLMGDERKYLDRTSFFDARHRKVDRKVFLSAFSGALDQLLGRQAEIGPENHFKLEPEVYSPLDQHSGYPCGQCGRVFRVDWELEEHWKSFPDHRL